MATDEWLTRKEVSQREKIPEATLGAPRQRTEICEVRPPCPLPAQ